MSNGLTWRGPTPTISFQKGAVKHLLAQKMLPDMQDTERRPLLSAQLAKARHNEEIGDKVAVNSRDVLPLEQAAGLMGMGMLHGSSARDVGIEAALLETFIETA